MKFKKGDEVRILDARDCAPKEAIGKKGEVVEVIPKNNINDGYYKVRVSEAEYLISYYESSLELAEEPTKEIDTMDIEGAISNAITEEKAVQEQWQPKRGEWVEVTDSWTDDFWFKAVYIATVDEVKNPIIASHHLEHWENGGTVEVQGYLRMRKLETKQLTHAELEEKYVQEPFEYVKE